MDDKKGGKKWLLYIILGGFLIELFRFLYRLFGNSGVVKKNVEDFVKEEKKEIKELKEGRESFIEYCRNSSSLFANYFIPNNCNDFKPKILRTKSLVIILIVMVALKIFVTGYMFAIYPNEARMEEQMTAEILRLTNEDRVKNGLTALKINSILNSAALAKAEDMGVKNYFAHYGPDGKKPWDWVDRNQYTYLLIGENLGMNFSTAGAVHVALMNSPSHRHNILNEKYEDVGIAIISCEIDGQKTNVLVELFGKERSKTLAVDTKTTITTAGTTPKSIDPNAGKTAIEKPQVAGTTKVVNQTPANAQIVKNEITKEPTTTVTTKEIAQANKFSSQTEIKSAEIVAQEISESTSTITSTVGDLPAEDIQPALESMDNQVKYVAPAKDKKIGFATSLVKTSKIVYLGVLLLMVATLLLNIFVRITIQHKSIIIQTMVVILLIVGMMTLKWHILENISDLIAIV